MKELIKIQSELKAPKGQYNKFGGFNYRSAEDILEAVKPLCHKNNCVLTLSDTLENIGERRPYLSAHMPEKTRRRRGWMEVRSPEQHRVTQGNTL